MSTIAAVVPAPARAGLGFVAGASSVLVFQQGMWILLFAIGLMPLSPFPVRTVQPFGVPQIIDLCLWGGIYGAVFGLVLPRLPGHAPRWLLGLGLGFCAMLFGWFVLAPMLGLAVMAGADPIRMAVSALINGAWGVGVALILHLLLVRRAGAA